MPTQKRCDQCSDVYQARKRNQRFCSCRCRAVWVRRTNEAALKDAQTGTMTAKHQEAA